MADKYDPLPDLAALFHAALWGHRDVTVYADRIAEQLGLGEDDSTETITTELRKALGLAARDDEIVHVHRRAGQVLRHAHPGGSAEHGYFDHPEGGTVRGG